MTHQEAVLLAKALHLLNEKPRFGPRDRRAGYDSYSVAADLTELLRRKGYDQQALARLREL